MIISGISITDLILIVLLGTACGGVLYYLKKKKSKCSHDCTGCHASCSSRSPDGVPEFVKAYRKDHPKQKDDAKEINE